ncbi:MAG: 1-acyl-sn-glycerol-3-phosphate acyltransferase [Bacteroidia bacterium]
MMKRFTSDPPPRISDFAREFDFENLRPYYDSEVETVMDRISREELYHKLMAYLWTGISKEEAIAKTKGIHSIYDFQTSYMSHAIWTIVNRSSTGLTWSGIEHLDKNKAYLFIANHRDILLDSAMMQIIMEAEQFPTSEITFGSNLMEQGFITDFGRMNRMFTVKREGTVKELYDISKQLSAYIRHTISDKNVSVWIAQRNGRTKDGHDQTQTGLLKMLNLSGTGDFESNFAQLNIVPVTVSYEYEPCDALKAQELYLSSLHSKYIKAPGEDLNSIITGIQQPKGKIHMAFGKPLNAELTDIDKLTNENDKIRQLAMCIDNEIYKNFKLQAVNYAAYDIAQQTNVFEKNYTAQEKADFLNYVDEKVKPLKGEPEVLKQILIKMYSLPVSNKLNLKK